MDPHDGLHDGPPAGFPEKGLQVVGLRLRVRRVGGRRQDRGHHVGGAPLVAHQLGVAADDEFLGRYDRVLRNRDALGRQRLRCGLQAVAHTDAGQPGNLTQHAHHAQRGPPQPIGVGGTGGFRAEGEHRHQQVEAVPKGQQGARKRGRDRVGGGVGLFHLVEGLGDRGGLAFAERVLAGYETGEAGHVRDEVRRQVVLRQLPGACQGCGLLRGEAQPLPHTGGHRGDAAGALPHRAEPVLEGQLLEARHEDVDRFDLEVLVPEEQGVLVAGPQHRLVARRHHGLVAGSVGHGHEIRQQAPLGVADRQVTLMLCHDRDQNPVREFQVALVETAQHPEGFLHQVGDLVDQRGIVLEIDDASHTGCQFLRLVHDRPSAFRETERDPSLGEQARQVVGGSEVVESDRNAVETFPAPGGCGGGALQIGAAPRGHLGDAGRDDLFPPERHQPAHGPGEGQLRVAPAHVLLGAQPGNAVLDEALQHLQGVAAR